MHFTLDDKKGNGGYANIFAIPLLLTARVSLSRTQGHPLGCIIAPLENLREL